MSGDSTVFLVINCNIHDTTGISAAYHGDDQQLAQVKWEKYSRTLQVKMAPDYNFSTKSVGLQYVCLTLAHRYK